MNTIRICSRLFATSLSTTSHANVLNRSVAYKSAISLENIYPSSTLKLSTPSKPPVDGQKFNGYIPIDEVEVTYSRSTGPGGQNVNKVNTKVDVRFKVESAKWLSNEVKAKLVEKLANKITKDGYLIYRSDITRSQQLNLADCLEKIRTSIRNCLIEKAEPTPETQEKIRRRLEKAATERLAIKRARSHTKSDRQSPNVVL